MNDKPSQGQSADYESPELEDLGTLVEHTQGAGSGIPAADFGSS